MKLPVVTKVLGALAERFGLARVRGRWFEGARVGGAVDGRHVVCSMTDSAVRIEALLEPALDLGLDISTSHIALAPIRPRALLLDDPAWDQELSASADEPARGALLFGDELRGAVLGLNATTMGVTLNDERVAALTPYMDVGPAIDALPRVARVAALVDAARASVRPAEPLVPYAEILRAFGAGPERRLAVEGTPLRASGELLDASIAVSCPRTGRGSFDVQVQAAALEAAADIGLLVRRESMIDRARTLLGGQDLRTGDPAFDPAFLVQAADPERALAALDGDVRALLLDLRGRFDEVTLAGATLDLRGPVKRLRPEDTPAALELAATVVARVARASGAVLRGPYR